MPLNGRQFANLAATLPGVGLGNHSDPTKSTQYSPQINGGNGRNVNYQIDGGDNNDDTVGGLLQLFPLEAIQEFNFVTSRSKAENGRSNGGVMNIVTKSGTNNLHGSFFELFRDTSMNAKTDTEKSNNAEKQDYRRNQFGGSFGGPIVKDKVHYFAAVERTQQDTFQVGQHQGPVPGARRHLRDAVPRDAVEREGDRQPQRRTNYLSVRYGRNQNSQPYGAANNRAPSNWGDSTNEFNSINVNHNWVIGGSKLNEFIFQYADFPNDITARQHRSATSCSRTASPSARARTRRRRTAAEEVAVPRRLLVARHRHGRHRPRLQDRRELHQRAAPVHHLQHRQGRRRSITYLTDNVNGADLERHRQRRRRVGQHPAEAVRVLRPGRLGGDRPADAQPRPALRPDQRLPVRPVAEPELRDHAERRQGRVSSPGIKGLENFGQDPKNDTNNWQPRLGFA